MIALMIAMLVACIALSAFFSASETAFSALNRVKMKTMAAEGSSRAALVVRLSEEYDRLLTTVLIGNNLVNIGGTAIATMLFLHLMKDGGASVSTVVMTVLVLIFGEVSPKTIAKAMPETIAMGAAPVLRVLMTLLRPVDWLFSKLRKLLARWFVREYTESHVEAEIMTMVDEAQHDGDLDAHEGELIRSAIAFNNQDAMDILTPRVDMTAIEDTATLEEAAELFRQTGYSRIPVYHEDMDHIVGILHEKDFYNARHQGETDLRRMMKAPVWAPATLPIDKLLKLFQTSKTHLVILLDEFGGTEGLVTLEDVLEELVGEIYDEHDDIDQDFVQQADGSLLVDGSVQLSDLLERLHVPDTYDADTVGGWAAEVLGVIPTVGSRFTEAGITAEVVEMDRRRVKHLRIEPKQDTETAEASAKKEKET